MEIQTESIRMCRWNIKQNSFPTTRNGNFRGKDFDSVCCSLIFHELQFRSENDKIINLKIKDKNSDPVISDESSKPRPWVSKTPMKM
jgi:hypothetical protein